ncbi:MAG: ABC transporter ATP-binding protein [Candidatus Baldrarchaeia archaeon]
MIKYRVKKLTLGSFTLENIEFDLNRGDVLLIIGPNGSGKTAIIYSLLGLIRYRGQILIDNVPPGTRQARRLICYVPEKPMLHEELSGLHNIEYYLALNSIGISEVRISLYSVADKLDVGGLLNKPAKTYSQGTKRKINVIQAYIVNKPVVLIDDYESNLDDKTIEFICEWIRKSEEKVFVLTSSKKKNIEELRKKTGKELKIVSLEEAIGERKNVH